MDSPRPNTLMREPTPSMRYTPIIPVENPMTSEEYCANSETVAAKFALVNTSIKNVRREVTTLTKTAERRLTSSSVSSPPNTSGRK